MARAPSDHSLPSLAFDAMPVFVFKCPPFCACSVRCLLGDGGVKGRAEAPHNLQYSFQVLEVNRREMEDDFSGLGGGFSGAMETSRPVGGPMNSWDPAQGAKKAPLQVRCPLDIRMWHETKAPFILATWDSRWGD
ncbi:hypothetical protein ISCGN_001885 [Ixodes scapularis]